MPDLGVLLQHLPPVAGPPRLSSLEGADFYRIWDARALVLDADRYFRMQVAGPMTPLFLSCMSVALTAPRVMMICGYAVVQGLAQASRDAGMVVKEANTLVEAWPLRPRRRPGRDGAREFRMLLTSDFSGLERYVEWKRAGDD